MESIEKLRKLTICDKGEKYTAYLDAGDIADEIEREIAEKYMLLPVVDGRPVHIGDELEWTDGYEPYERFTVGMIGRTYCDESYQDFAETHEHGISFGCCRWPEPDRVKELLEEFADKIPFVWDGDKPKEAWPYDSLMNEYAAKIREAVSADE